MEEEIEKYLEILNSEKCIKDSKEAGIIVNKLHQCLKQEQSQFTIGLLIGLILDENDAIFKVIWKTHQRYETTSSTVAIFKLLHILVDEFQHHTKPYFGLLLQKCMHLLDAKFAKVKELSLSLIKKLLMCDSLLSHSLGKLISKIEKLLKNNKVNKSVAGESYSILGYIFAKYPELLESRKVLFFNKMCKSLDEEMKGIDYSSSLMVKDILEGIDGYMTSYKVDNTEALERIYGYLKSLSNFRQEKRTGSRAALKLFLKHWTHFSKFVFEDREIWERNLTNWLHQSSEDHQSAFQAFNAFYSVIVFFGKQDPNYLEVLNNYLNNFKKNLSSSEHFYEKKLALVGIKLFVLTNALDGDNFSDTYDLVMDFVRDCESVENYSNLPLCIECISAFVLKLSTKEVFNLEYLSCLQRLSVILINHYPNVEKNMQQIILTSLEKSFYMLGLCNLSLVDNHIHSVIYQALIRTCSYLTLADLDFLKNSVKEKVQSISYKSYLSLWEYFLNLINSPVLPIDGSFTLKKGVAIKVFNAVIDSFLKILLKLNLNVDETQLTLEKEAVMEKPSDLNLFINCVDFYQDLIPLIDANNLHKWFVKIFHIVIDLSQKHPLVAGFYKIITSTLKASNHVHFFEEEKDKLSVLGFISKFLESLLRKIDQYKGDLQIACLETLLSAPASFIESFVEEAIPILEVAVQLGRSHFPLLKNLVESLERWNFYLPLHTMGVIIPRIIPQFDLFFQSQYFRGTNVHEKSLLGKKLKKKLVFNDSELLVLQKQFLLFLGNLDINLTMNLIELGETKEEDRRINEKHLLYSPPFCNGNIEIHLDEILPRVMDLAISCSDRGTRIAACELLYSSVMVTLSSINQLNGEHACLFRKMMKTCLTLGSDTDCVIYQIFEPLMFQIVHYFSGKKAMYFTETLDLIDILIDFSTLPYNPAARDLAALLICEFTTWLIRQLTPAELRITPDSINKILYRIFSLALHPSYNKRLGAALIFNKMYKVLREEDFILEASWFQLYYYFMESLRMCDETEDVTEIKKAIEHVKRPLLENHEEFNNSTSYRIVPPGFEGDQLCHLVKWTTVTCCDPRPMSRRVAMALVQELAPLVRGCGSLSAFIKVHLPGSLILVKANFFEKSNTREEDYISWLNNQSALFEYYTWMLCQGVLAAEQISLSQFKSILENYTQSITLKREKSVACDFCKRESILHFINLLLAFKERAFYFPNEVWQLLKILTFKPSELGFDFNNLTSNQDLMSSLSSLLKHLSVKLTSYNWHYFYENLQLIISVPVLHYITRNRYVTLQGAEFLFGIKIIEMSGIWEEFIKQTHFSMDGGLIVEIIFRSLFTKQRKNHYTINLDPSCKLYLEELMKVSFRIGVSLDDLLNFVQDSEEVLEEDTSRVLTKGEYFHMQFEDVVFGTLQSQGKELVDKVLNKGNSNDLKFLIHVLAKEQPKDVEAKLSQEVLRRWKDFEKLNVINVCHKEKNKMLLRLAVGVGLAFGTPGCFKTSLMEDWVYSILEREKFRELDCEEIKAIFDLIPALCSYCENENVRLENSLNRFLVHKDFLKTHTQNFVKSINLELAINGLLKALKLTGSLAIFQFALSKVIWFEMLCKKEIPTSSFFLDFPQDHCVKALNLAYKSCFDDQQENALVLTIYKWFLNPLMELVSSKTIYKIVMENLESWCTLIKTYCDGKLISLGTLRTGILRMTCATGILQSFATKMSKKELEEMSVTEKRAIEMVVKSFFHLLRALQPFTVLKERYRKLMCEVFNMICSIISLRSTDPKVYKLFIFDERGSILYETVNTSVCYNLDMDFNEIPKRKKFLTSLRKTATKESQIRLNKTLNTIKYIQTNTLFTSSLREDVTKFDLTYSAICPMSSVEDTNAKDFSMEIELEVDSFNTHECMPTLVGIITKLVNEKITPLPEADEDVEVPCWLSFFLSVFKSPKLSENIKLFTLKALYNVQQYVKPYCKVIFTDVLTFILNFFSDSTISYFLIDLIEMIIDWKYIPKDEVSKLQLTILVKFVMSKSSCLKKEIIKNNLEVIKAMVEVWKDALVQSDLSAFVFERLLDCTSRDFIARKDTDEIIYFNVQICGIMLANSISPWKISSEKEFFKAIVATFRDDNKNQQVYAQVCGLALNHLEKTSFGDFEWCETLVRNKISSMVLWVPIIYGIHKHYPKMSSKFIFKLFSSAWDSADSFTSHKLEMLLSHVSEENSEDDTFDRHSHLFLIDMLNSSDVYVQELSLQIADKVLGRLEDNKMNELAKIIFPLQTSVYPSLRKWVYEIAIKYYSKHPNSFEITTLCKNVLLKGLNDHVEELEKFCLKFWCDFLNLSSPYSSTKVLKEMYTPDTEDIFLSNVTKVLLNSAVTSDQCHKSIFPHPIAHQSKFKKRSIILETRQSSLLGFMSTRISTNQSLEHMATLKTQTFPHIRPTCTLKFNPTVADVEEEEDEVAVVDSQPETEPDIPKNPFKRRFYKSAKKTNFFFMRQRQKRKKELEAEEELMRKKETQVHIFGEYRLGNYPDIEISHFHVLKPLEELIKKDNQIAKQFLASFYSGLISSANESEKSVLLSEMNECFKNILKTSTSFCPGVLGFVLQVLLKHCENLQIDCESITNAAVSSNLLSLGALLTEEIITNDDNNDDDDDDDDLVVPPAKIQKGNENPRTKKWIELAKLYRSLEEFDVLSGIFLDKLEVSGDAREAISCESLLDWSEACKYYENILQVDSGSQESEFYSESYFSCLAKLSSWSRLNECIRTTVDQNLDELWKNYNLLSWFLKSEVMKSLGTDKKDFVDFLTKASNDKNKINVLNSNFGEELAAFDFISGKLQKASYRIDRLCLDFLAAWSHLNRWSYNLRATKLINLQTIAELDRAVKILGIRNKSELEQSIKMTRKHWEKNVPCPRDDLQVWDIKLSYRHKFINELKEFDMTESGVRSSLALTKVALDQGNLRLAKECLSRIKENLHEVPGDLKAEYDYCFNLGKMVVAKSKMKEENEGVQFLLYVWSGILKQMTSAMESNSGISQTHMFRCNFTLGQLVSLLLPSVINQNVSPEILNAIKARLNSSESPGALKNKGLEYLETAREISERVEVCYSLKSCAYLELVKFLFKYLDKNNFFEFKKLATYLLKAMALGNAEARRLFGCLLNLSDIVPDVTSLESLITESSFVPSWMFLMWINQIFARLDSKMFLFLKYILLQIADEYPNALRYPLRLCKEKLKSEKSSVKLFVKELAYTVCSDKIYESFLNALNYIGTPDLILKFHLENALREVDRKNPDYPQMKSILKNLHELMFSPVNSKFRGPVFNYWETFKDPLEDLLAAKENKGLLSKIHKILASMETSAMPSKRTLRFLESYCPWLRNFHSLKEGTGLELPGQYDGNHKPIKKYLVTVSSFSNDVIIFNSKCKPIRIGILGNDAIEHKFLIKFGEDLRQDERIQQVFGHFNYKLRENKQTRRFSVDTYKVIPLTLSLGMIEWIENNVSLHEMIENSLGNDADLISKAQTEYLEFLSQCLPKKGGSNPTTVDAHLAAYELIERDSAISNFNVMVNKFPKNLLKKSLWNLSNSPEHFIYLRGNFATSHAVMCITHWLVGIGDRHLQNILVSTKTGRVLGIDFGYAFGFATKFLAPPELIPFRLTSQILHLMHPLKESGWIKQTMIHCLRVFRKEHFGLLSVLDVFALDPVVDWSEQARKNHRHVAEDLEPSPTQMISLVRDKLNGANPVYVAKADLEAGQSKSKFLSKYLEVLKGIEQINIRTACGEKELSEEKQVECLIDLATDPHVLSKTYLGWNPWL